MNNWKTRDRRGCGIIYGTRGFSLKVQKQITEGLRPR